VPGNSGGGDGRADENQGKDEAEAKEGEEGQEQTCLHGSENQGASFEGSGTGGVILVMQGEGQTGLYINGLVNSKK